MAEKRIFEDANIHRPSGQVKSTTASWVNITCPHCCRMGTFNPIYEVADVGYQKFFREGKARGEAGFQFGIRQCPNPECRGLVAFLQGRTPYGGLITWSAPPEIIDFRVDQIPEKIVQSMQEAIISHAQKAFRASALMVRRTLELLCQDKGSKGKDLKARIAGLSQYVVISPTLLAAADNLRLLGNDAAHVEAKTYDDIDDEHARLAIELAKEILKAVYQHDDLVARLTKLQNQSSP